MKDSDKAETSKLSVMNNDDRIPEVPEKEFTWRSIATAVQLKFENKKWAKRMAIPDSTSCIKVENMGINVRQYTMQPKRF
jgi:hypothetical protein